MVETQPAGAQKVSSEDSTAASCLIRWGGPAAVLGGVVFLLANILPVTNGMHEALWGAGFALVLVGITGVYLHLRRSGRIGLSGTVGFYMYVIAFVVPTILSLGGLLNLWGARWTDPGGGVQELTTLLGSALFGVAILRAGVGPLKGGAWLLIAGVITEVGAIAAMVVSGFTLGQWVWTVPTVVFVLGWVWLGYGLWSASGASDGGRPSRVS